MSGFGLLNLLMFNFPVVILIEEAEDLTEVLRLLLQQLCEDVKLSPLNLAILVQIKGLQQLLLDLLTVQVLQVVGVSGSFNVTSALLHHLQH